MHGAAHVFPVVLTKGMAMAQAMVMAIASTAAMADMGLEVDTAEASQDTVQEDPATAATVAVEARHFDATVSAPVTADPMQDIWTLTQPMATATRVLGLQTEGFSIRDLVLKKEITGGTGAK